MHGFFRRLDCLLWLVFRLLLNLGNSLAQNGFLNRLFLRRNYGGVGCGSAGFSSPLLVSPPMKDFSLSLSSPNKKSLLQR